MAAPRLLFNFITDEELRAVLESDYAEMQTCSAQGAYKAVHVLAGSIVEAVLVDYLLGAGQKSPDPLQMSFSELIAACKKAGVLSQRTGELSGALKSFRNLIHPGRVKRLGERVDADGANVAQSLVSIVVREVAAKREENYGLTAEQILTKFASDPSALGISEHLLAEAPDGEIERLLLRVLPERYFEELQGEFTDSRVLEGHSRLFRAAFQVAPERVKGTVTQRYVTVLKEEAGPRVLAYEEEFFRAGDLQYLEEADQVLVKAHLISRVRDDPNVKVVRAAEGIGGYLTQADFTSFIDEFVRVATTRSESAVGRAAKSVLEREAARTSMDLDPAIMRRLDDWVGFYEERERPDDVAIVQSIKAAYEAFGDIPF